MARDRLPPSTWYRWRDEHLLDLQLCRLDLSVEGTWLERCVRRLYAELGRRRVTLRPHVWLSNEWFSPTGVPGFAIPFYLAHPRLIRLERAQMGSVEGGTINSCMAIMRHEAGHTLQTAYRLHARPGWRRVFGSSAARYPERYRPDRASRRFVRNLPCWYAQSHPDEDFAETFAVWLGPRTAWRRKYAGWPEALRKLEYVDAVLDEVVQTQPMVVSRRQVQPLGQLRRTLRAHYAARRRRYLGPLGHGERGWLPL